MSDAKNQPVYVYVFIGLAALTLLTVAFAFIDLGGFNLFTALLIAGLKALLIIYFFMHITHMESVVKIFALAGLFWLFIMFLYTFSDYLSRNWVTNPSFWK